MTVLHLYLNCLFTSQNSNGQTINKMHTLWEISENCNLEGRYKLKITRRTAYSFQQGVQQKWQLFVLHTINMRAQLERHVYGLKMWKAYRQLYRQHLTEIMQQVNHKLNWAWKFYRQMQSSSIRRGTAKNIPHEDDTHRGCQSRSELKRTKLNSHLVELVAFQRGYFFFFL